jgi:type IV pilus assembly protein PilY1
MHEPALPLIHSAPSGTRVRCSRAAAILLPIVLATCAGDTRGDDTQPFFNSAGLIGRPSVLIAVATSREMGCAPGDGAPCAAPPPPDLLSRLDVVKLALADLLESVEAEGLDVQVGLMRARNDGEGSRGAFVLLDAVPVEHQYDGPFAGFPDRTLAQALDVVCPPGRPACAMVGSLDGAPPVEPLSLPDHPAFDPPHSGQQRVAEILFEAYRYYAGLAPLDGADSRIGPGYIYPGDLAGDGREASLRFFPPVMTQDGCEPPVCRYRSPIEAGCLPSHVVIISDGVLGDDTGADDWAQLDTANPTRIWFRNYVDPAPLAATAGGLAQSSLAPAGAGACSINAVPAAGPGATGHCADDIAYSLRLGGWHPAIDSAQLRTHTIGLDVANAAQAAGHSAAQATAYLELVARAGGGRHHAVHDRAGLYAALRSVVEDTVTRSASNVAPSVPVDAFNRMRHLGDVYLPLFRPSASQRWRGNIGKYRLDEQGRMLGRNGALAVDPADGGLLPGIPSLWPAVGDLAVGADPLDGGAAAALPPPAERRIYTNLDDANSQALADYELARLPAHPDAAGVLGYTAAGVEPPPCPAQSAIADAQNPAICELVAWIHGADAADRVPHPTGNGDVTEPRHDLGDSLHSRPTVVVYGGDSAAPSAVVYALTNDGLLHAFDAQTGRERWSFVPWDRLARMLALYRDAGAQPRSSLGLDGTLRAFKLDLDGDGTVEPAAGDRVILYFGMRRGGQRYYAVDVTAVDPAADPAGDTPQLLWIAGPEDDAAIPANRRLPLIGQTWSRPAVTRLSVPGHAGNDDRVVLFAGGYDPQLDAPDGRPRPYADSAIGTGVYALDAFTGQLLWRAGPDAAADLVLPEMTGAMPADLATLDLTGDGYVDLAYVGDLHGHVWRVDFEAAASDVASLAAGRVFADLGGQGVAGARRFFSSPDVSSVMRRGRRWLNVGIGSGHRELPVSDGCTPFNVATLHDGDADACIETDDRYYALRDHQPLRIAARPAPVLAAITEADLADVTPADGAAAAVPDDGAGWMLRLDSAPGEKAISSSRTFDHTVLVPTFVPLPRDQAAGDACSLAVGYNHLYQLRLLDGGPSPRLARSGEPLVAGGLALRLAQPGIAPQPLVVFPPATEAADDDGVAAERARPRPVCLVGSESCGRFDEIDPQKTFWRQRGTE